MSSPEEHLEENGIDFGDPPYWLSLPNWRAHVPDKKDWPAGVDYSGYLESHDSEDDDDLPWDNPPNYHDGSQDDDCV